MLGKETQSGKEEGDGVNRDASCIKECLISSFLNGPCFRLFSVGTVDFQYWQLKQGPTFDW